MQLILITNEAALASTIKKAENCDVYCFFSSISYMLQSYSGKLIKKLLLQCDSDITTIGGPKLDIEAITAAAGVISFFGTKRIVFVKEIELTALTDKDAQELCDIIQNVENAVIIITCIIKDDKALTTKKAKMIADTAEKAGVCAHIKNPSVQDAQRFVVQRVQSLGAQISQAGASLIVERLGTDYALIKSEVAKLAAVARYEEITREIIDKMCTKNIEANVFDMVRYVTMRQLPRAIEKLKELFDLQNDEIQITAALSGAFVDMYRVKTGARYGAKYNEVFKDFGYKGSDYRLKKSSETAAHFSEKQLGQILKVLCTLDEKLKSSPAEKKVLLQTALCEIGLISNEKK